MIGHHVYSDTKCSSTTEDFSEKHYSNVVLLQFFKIIDTLVCIDALDTGVKIRKTPLTEISKNR